MASETMSDTTAHTGPSGPAAVHPELNRTFRVRADAFYVRQQDGVWLGNNTGSFSVRGQGAYELVSSLFAGLDGERTLQDLYGNVPERARRSVVSLVNALLRNGLIKEVSHPAEPVPGWMRERYATHLAFLEHHADRPVTRLQRVRTRRVVCAGRGTALRALLDALRDFGIAQLDVLADGDPDLAPVLEDAAAADPGARWRLHDDLGPAGPAALADHPSVDGADVVLLAYDTADAAELAEAQHRLWARGPAVGILGRCGDFVTAVAPGLRTPACWECVHRSLAATAVGDTDGLEPAVAPAAIGALRLAEHTFVRLADVEPSDGKPVTTVEPLVPVVRNHSVPRHPCCPHHPPLRPESAAVPDGTVVPEGTAAPDRTGTASVPEDAVRPDIPAPEDPPARVAVSDRIVAASARLTDPLTGPLLALGEDDLGQLPLSASACRVADPAGSADAPGDLRVVCRALAPREARNQAVLFALEWLAERVARQNGLTPDALPEGYRFGAGWSSAEAHLRARLNAALAAPAGALDWTAAPDGPAVGPPQLGFLAGALAVEQDPWRSTAVETLPHGVVRAHVRTGSGESTTGVGTHRDQAIGHALSRALARHSTGLDDAAGRGVLETVAFLAPPVGTWTEALKGPGPRGALDVTGLLPFLRTGDAYDTGARICLIAVSPLEVTA